MIDLCDISKIYRVGDEEIHALDRVSMTVAEGEFVGITGPSGSGKSTMMHIIGCLDTADYGTYRLDGQPVEHRSEGDLAVIRNRKIGFIFQSFNLISRMTLEENVELPLIYQGVSPHVRRERVGAALERVGLSNRRKHTPNSISGGQQQRAAIARALVTEPALILADEPTGNLDSKTGESILELFRELNASGKTIVLITHDNHIAGETGRTIRIMDGRIEGTG
ncbi:MAG: ABC transporter ATP-binding protein [Clostridiales Family XIII bacterium]|jgi:putative ABC transport system ATP-binding protein|nr:ABC transporter ATP-binding protein [Clostridiales Family XIII bacterium]